MIGLKGAGHSFAAHERCYKSLCAKHRCWSPVKFLALDVQRDLKEKGARENPLQSSTKDMSPVHSVHPHRDQVCFV